MRTTCCGVMVQGQCNDCPYTAPIRPKLLAAPKSTSAEPVAFLYIFDRYVNGCLMAEDIGVHAKDFIEAEFKAKQILSQHYSDQKRYTSLVFSKCKIDSAPQEAQLKAAQREVLEEIKHSSCAHGYKCADCLMTEEPCPSCYEHWWLNKHPNFHQIA